MKLSLTKLCVLGLIVHSASAQTLLKDCYKIENIKLPEGTPPEVGAIDFAPDGTLFVVLRRGDILRATPTDNPDQFDWKVFATGFHNGCGIDVISSSKIRVTQMAEMTQAEDLDGDGSADKYTRFSSGWGLSGNYHETNALTRDGEGGYFLGIGTASFAGPTFHHTLGEYSPAGRRGRNYSSVKWKGWILYADKDGNVTPYASGFRMQNGIYKDPDGNLWSGDNEGDWKAATPLYHVEKGNFYGHPSSLVWDPEFKKSDDPLAYYRENLEEYNKDRTYPAVEVPHMEMIRSAGEPMEFPRDGSFGPFAGQMLLPDNNGSRIARLMLEKVNGTWQGAVTQFINGHGLRSGNHRLHFSPDGKQLYVGQTVRGWGSPAEGLQRITWLGKTPFDIETIKITPSGFLLTFTKDIPAALKDASKWNVTSFTYQPKWTYGSDEDDKKDHPVSISSEAPNSLTLTLDGLSPHRVFSIKIPKAQSADGSPLQNESLFYTVNSIPKP